MAQRAPRQWSLTKEESVNSFESWRQNLLYIFSLDHNFARYLADGFTWQRKTAANPNRGLVADVAPVPEAQRRTAPQKSVQLDLLLGQIANYCPIISRNTIVKNSTSLPTIWQAIRQHFGFQSTGAHFLDLADIKLQAGEKPQDLYQRLMAFFDDNLLTRTGGITHHGVVPNVDEDMTPTLENTVVVLWLQMIHPGLPLLVKQRYGTELRNQSLASLKPEISIALGSLLDELRSIEDSKVMRSAAHGAFPGKTVQFSERRAQSESCILCKTAGRTYNNHTLPECRFISRAGRRGSQSRLVSTDVVGDSDTEAEDDEMDGACADPPSALLDSASVHRVKIIQSPYLSTFYRHQNVRLTLDTGATSSYIRSSLAHELGLPVKTASQMARQASWLEVVGEVHFPLSRGPYIFQMDALVVRHLEDDILAGIPFLAVNDIAVRPAKRQIVVHGSDVISYGSQPESTPSVRRAQAHVLQSPVKTVLMPGEFIQVSTPKDLAPDSSVAIEPHFDAPHSRSTDNGVMWPRPQELSTVDHNIRLLNDTRGPIRLSKHQHVCQVRQCGGALEVGRPKNLNTNPVAESAIKELGLECLHLSPEGGPLSKVQLSLATASLNARLHRDGLSAREMWTQRDQFTGQQLAIQDRHIVRQQQLPCSQSHRATALSKARGKTAAPEHDLHVGDLVYLGGYRDKTRGRDKYLVVSKNDIMCQLRKFTTSPFRSKTYNVRLSDCFPVVSTALLQEHDPGPLRGLQDVYDCGGATRSEPCILSPTADMSSSIPPYKSLRPTLGQRPPIDTGTFNLTQLSQS